MMLPDESVIGVIGMIYESRPNVTIEAASLSIKSGNACILRGGSEAIDSNKALAALGGRVEAVFFCPHTAADACDCRKPKPGLLDQISERFGIELKGVPIVGDSLRDLEAGVAVGCTPHLVLTGKGQKTLDKGSLPPGTRVHDPEPGVPLEL